MGGMFKFEVEVRSALSDALDYAPATATEGRRLFAGIDPGKSGYIAVVDMTENPSLVWAEPMPVFDGAKGVNGYDLQEMWRLIQRLQPANIIGVVLEQQQPFPKQGGVSNFSLGYVYGMLRGLLVAAGVSHEVVHPTRWKRAMNIKGAGDDPVSRKADGKRKSVSAVQALIPKVDLRPTARAKKPSVDKAEAILLAVYAGRNLAWNG